MLWTETGSKHLLELVNTLNKIQVPRAAIELITIRLTGPRLQPLGYLGACIYVEYAIN